jgi:hypothetical protein
MSDFSSTPAPLSTITTSSLLNMSSTAVPIHHVATIRLTKANYLLWRAQLLPHLRGNGLMGYLDGTNAAPDQQVPASSAAGAMLIINPNYTAWYNKDQQILSGLLSSMSEEILRDVIDTKTSKNVWDSL